MGRQEQRSKDARADEEVDFLWEPIPRKLEEKVSAAPVPPKSKTTAQRRRKTAKIVDLDGIAKLEQIVEKMKAEDNQLFFDDKMVREDQFPLLPAKCNYSKTVVRKKKGGSKWEFRWPRQIVRRIPYPRRLTIWRSLRSQRSRSGKSGKKVEPRKKCLPPLKK